MPHWQIMDAYDWLFCIFFYCIEVNIEQKKSHFWLWGFWLWATTWQQSKVDLLWATLFASAETTFRLNLVLAKTHFISNPVQEKKNYSACNPKLKQRRLRLVEVAVTMEMYKPANVRVLSERTSETVSSNCTITKAMLYYTFVQYKLNIYRSIHFDQVGNWLLWNLGFALWDE